MTYSLSRLNLINMRVLNLSGLFVALLLHPCLGMEKSQDLSGTYTTPLCSNILLGHDLLIDLKLDQGSLDRYSVYKQFTSDVKIGHIHGELFFGEAIAHDGYVFISTGLGSKDGNEVTVSSTIERYSVFNIGEIRLLLNDSAHQAFLKTRELPSVGVLVFTDEAKGLPFKEVNRMSLESLRLKVKLANQTRD